MDGQCVNEGNVLLCAHEEGVDDAPEREAGAPRTSSAAGERMNQGHVQCAPPQGACACAGLIDSTLVVPCGNELLSYQLGVVEWTTRAMTGDGELGFDSGEGA